VIDLLTEMQRKIDAAPPRIYRLYATHSVPYGRVYRMWTTRGDLIAYVNRGQVADMPRAKGPDLGMSRLVGISVVFE
jgi:hypothetical protein